MGILIGGGILTAVGLDLLAGAGWKSSRQYTIIKSWPTVEAEVTKSRVDDYQSHDSNRYTTTTLYKAEIEFRS